MILKDLVGKTVTRVAGKETDDMFRVYFSDGAVAKFEDVRYEGMIAAFSSREERIERWREHRKTWPERLRKRFMLRAASSAEYYRRLHSLYRGGVWGKMGVK